VIHSVTPQDVDAVDFNAAPAGVAHEHLVDAQRELPPTTNVIDAGLFLSALARIGYDGPVRAEPFNAALNAMDDDAACAATIAAIRRALASVRS
jgi:sugar phosphate isomerase/epimerase